MNPIHLAVATVLLLVVVCPPATTPAQTRSPLADNVWLADNGDGTYRNPIIHADYSDPDAIRVNDDYYLVASSFNCVPGLPILHSKDLVNWEIIGHALRRQPPEEIFRKPQHGNGVWAPALRYHNDEFFIFYPDPDRGIYMVKAPDAGGPHPLVAGLGRHVFRPGNGRNSANAKTASMSTMTTRLACGWTLSMTSATPIISIQIHTAFSKTVFLQKPAGQTTLLIRFGTRPPG